jgi:hypothetical protein
MASTVLADGSDGYFSVAQQLEQLDNQLAIERQVYDGARSLLEVFEAQDGDAGQDALRLQVEGELRAANDRIATLHERLAAVQGASPDSR